MRPDPPMFPASDVRAPRPRCPQPSGGSPGGLPARADVLGLPVDVLRGDELLDLMDGWIAAWRATKTETDTASQPLHTVETAETAHQIGRARQVVTLNPEMAMRAHHDAALRATIRSADLVTADGIGVVWALRLRGVRAARRLTGVDLLDAFAARAAVRGYRIFLLGAAPGVAEAASARLHARHPGLGIAGTYAGSPRREDERDVLDRIAAARPDVVFVAFGSPAQETWIAEHRERLGAAVAIGVGGAFDFIAGRVPRAPEVVRRAGLEWLYRLWREPWRWRRMLALPRFAVAAIAESVAASVGKRKREARINGGRSEH